MKKEGERKHETYEGINKISESKNINKRKFLRFIKWKVFKHLEEMGGG
jgi:hypothetical protein